MKIACRIGDKPAMIVGYVQAKRGIHAVVIIGGELRHFGLRKIKLVNLPDDLTADPKVQALPVGKKA